MLKKLAGWLVKAQPQNTHQTQAERELLESVHVFHEKYRSSVRRVAPLSEEEEQQLQVLANITLQLDRPLRPPLSQSRTSSPSQPLHRLVDVLDFLPINLRKEVKAMATDYEPEIRRLREAHRPRAAKWNQYLAWGTAIGMVLKRPFQLVTWWLRKTLTGRVG
jgi:hypothetical protein